MVGSGSRTPPHRPDFWRDWRARSVNKTRLALVSLLLWAQAQRLGPCSLLMHFFEVSCQSCWTLRTASTRFSAVMLCLLIGTFWPLGSGLPTHPMLSALGLWPALVSFGGSALDSTPNLSPTLAAGLLPSGNTAMVAESHDWLYPASFSVHASPGHVCFHSENPANAGLWHRLNLYQNWNLPFFHRFIYHGNIMGHWEPLAQASLFFTPSSLDTLKLNSAEFVFYSVFSPPAFTLKIPALFCTSATSTTLLSFTFHSLCYIEDALFSFIKVILNRIFALLLPNVRNHCLPCMDVYVCVCWYNYTGNAVHLPLTFPSVIILETLSTSTLLRAL